MQRNKNTSWQQTAHEKTKCILEQALKVNKEYIALQHRELGIKYQQAVRIPHIHFFFVLKKEEIAQS